MAQPNRLMAMPVMEQQPTNALLPGGVTQADAWDVNGPAIGQHLAGAWSAAQDPAFWADAARQYGNSLLLGTGAPGARIHPTGNGSYDLFVGDNPAGRAAVISGGAGKFLDLINLSKQYRGQGHASAIYDQIEQDIGRPLGPSPLGLSDQATAFWRRRLAGMPPEQAQALIEQSRQAGREWGIPDERVEMRLAPFAAAPQ